MRKRNLNTLLEGKEISKRPLFWHYPHYGNQGGAPTAAIRNGPWKLIRWVENGKLELFDLSKDIGEKRNLVAEFPEVASKMDDQLTQWQAEVGAKMPTAR